MLKCNHVSRIIRGAALAALAFALAAPAAAETVYSWRTDDGSYAFTDDAKSIPAKYRSRARAHGTGSLDGYARHTPQDSAASSAYAGRLAARLAHLRERNQPLATIAEPTATPRTIALRTGGDDGLTLDISAAEGDAPVVVETIFTRPAGKMVTRQSQVVRQGDRTLAVIRPRLAEWNVADDIHVETY